tara:strand:- start:255 stop:608 length:354 start_codon:yes stop_codon:yes gene_type:complete
MRTILFTATILALLPSCTKEGPEYLCYDAKNDLELDATARLGLFSGKLEGFDATDRNGLEIRIDEENSYLYECYSQKDLSPQTSDAEKRQREECARLEALDEKSEFSTYSMSPCPTS